MIYKAQSPAGLNSSQLKKFSECAGVVVFAYENSDLDNRLENLLGVVLKTDDKNNAANILVNIETKIKSENILIL